jgi:hypothetical protein
MKLTKQQLRQIIKEELVNVLEEEVQPGIEAIKNLDLKIHLDHDEFEINIKVFNQQQDLVAKIEAEREINLLNSFEVVEWHVYDKNLKGKMIAAVLLDIVFELAGAAGVTPDKSILSMEAEEGFKYVFNNEGEYTRRQLPLNVSSEAFDDIYEEEMELDIDDRERYGEEYLKSFLTKVFYKQKMENTIERLGDSIVIKQEV